MWECEPDLDECLSSALGYLDVRYYRNKNFYLYYY